MTFRIAHFNDTPAQPDAVVVKVDGYNVAVSLSETESGFEIRIPDLLLSNAGNRDELKKKLRSRLHDYVAEKLGDEYTVRGNQHLEISTKHKVASSVIAEKLATVLRAAKTDPLLSSDKDIPSGHALHAQELLADQRCWMKEENCAPGMTHKNFLFYDEQPHAKMSVAQTIEAIREIALRYDLVIGVHEGEAQTSPRSIELQADELSAHRIQELFHEPKISGHPTTLDIYRGPKRSPKKEID